MTHLTTESRNPAAEKIDTFSPLEIVRLMNAEDACVAEAVGFRGEVVGNGERDALSGLRDSRRAKR